MTTLASDDRSFTGNAYTLPLVLDFYSTNATDEQARNVAANLQSRLRGDHHFRLAQQYRAASSSAKALGNSRIPAASGTVYRNAATVVSMG